MSRKLTRGIVKFVPNISKGLTVGSRAICADNSGAKIVEIIAVYGYKGRLNRYAKAGVGDSVTVSVKKGTLDMRRQVLQAVVVRQRKPYRRPDGTWIQFEDNAVAIIKPSGDPQGTEIRGPIAREVTRRWPRLSALASVVI